jgi:hypothetical protein
LALGEFLSPVPAVLLLQRRREGDRPGVVNDERAKRAYRSRTDAYTRLLMQGDPPDLRDALLASADTPSAPVRLARIPQAD